MTEMSEFPAGGLSGSERRDYPYIPVDHIPSGEINPGTRTTEADTNPMHTRVEELMIAQEGDNIFSSGARVDMSGARIDMDIVDDIRRLRIEIDQERDARDEVDRSLTRAFLELKAELRKLWKAIRDEREVRARSDQLNTQAILELEQSLGTLSRGSPETPLDSEAARPSDLEVSCKRLLEALYKVDDTLLGQEVLEAIADVERELG